jgi:pyrroloquinoline-quinone synthase
MLTQQSGQSNERPAVRAPRVTQCALETLGRVDIQANPYFVALAGGDLAKDVFKQTQRQFYFAVEFFSRPMAALVARIPNPRMRLDILHNVVEEHGEFDGDEFHETTFRRFLRSIGADAETLDGETLWPEVRAFNSALAGACIHDELEVGVACMGIIEHAFAGISETIGRAVVDQGWVAAEDLVHYVVHAKIDERHADEFYRVVEPHWDDPARRYFVEQGLELGAYIFDSLYRGLYEHGTRQRP